MSDENPTWHELADKAGAVLDELRERAELLTPVLNALDASTYGRDETRWGVGWHTGIGDSPWPTFNPAGIPTCACGGVMDYAGSGGVGPEHHQLVWTCTCGRHLAMELTRWNR